MCRQWIMNDELQVPPLRKKQQDSRRETSSHPFLGVTYTGLDEDLGDRQERVQGRLGVENSLVGVQHRLTEGGDVRTI